ncbi:hypothetical protein [Candidatus Methylocalor cossyra]|uniref:Carboxypeptidase regulatory-like domain-containing protein n=1 Tax=Candidatus Methylocalor cossyra TaxID=3108543 RepID=A0ABP1C5D2_9GAMM
MTQQHIAKTSLSPSFQAGFRAVSLALVVFLTGCGNDPGGSAAGPSTSEAHISGNVQDVHGPINDGKIEVRDQQGQLLTTVTLSGSNHYSITVPAGTRYPILLTAIPAPGSVANTVKAVVTSPLADRMDITDITTLVVDSAMTLGGLTAENIAKASGGAIGLRQRQGVSAAAGGGGAGPGQSGGGAGRGGHAGHDMSNMGSSAPKSDAPPSQGPMQH